MLALAGMRSSFMFTLIAPIQSTLPELLDSSRKDTAWVATSTLLAPGFRGGVDQQASFVNPIGIRSMPT